MENKITITCPAKINLSLDVIGKRADGYHELRMIMQTVDICDLITVSLSDNGNITVYSDNKNVPLGEDNIVYKAAKLFFEKLGKTFGAEIEIKKNIPMGAGMAGGSADAAGTLKALNILTNKPFSDEELEVMGKNIGADVPFCIRGGCCLCEGIGEVLTPLPEMKGVYLAVAKPEFSVSTPWVYKNLKLSEKSVHPETDKLIRALETGEYEAFNKFSGNTLESVTAGEYPEIAEYESLMKENGAFFSMMTGSGPTVFGLFKDKKNADTAASVLREKTKEVFVVKM